MKKIILAIMILGISFTTIACGNKSSLALDEVVGKYELESAYINDLEATDEYHFYNIELKNDYTMNVSLSYLGIIENRQSTFVIKGNQIIEKTKTNKENKFDFDNNKLTLNGKQNEDKLKAVFKKELSIEEIHGVDFDDILFGDDISITKIFNYAPSIIMDKDEQGNEIMHIWYCTNKQSGIIVDHIGYRKGTLNKNGKWEFNEETIVLAPTPGTWDGRHVCDPTVIKGEFNYNDEVYPYMMSYLGCVTEDYSNNETGIAVAKSPEGPWIKIDEVNPIVPYSHDNNPNGSWGTGMPVLMSVDQKGKVLLFYSSSSVGIGVQYWGLSDLNNPEKIFTSTISNKGAKNPNGTILNYLAISEFGYDKENGRLYMITTTQTQNPPDITPTRVDSHAMLAYIDGIDSMDILLETLQKREYEWNVVGFVGPEETGYERNHNLGMLKDSYGNVYKTDQIWVVVSTGRNSWPNDNIFTYRLKGYKFDIDK